MCILELPRALLCRACFEKWAPGKAVAWTLVDCLLPAVLPFPGKAPRRWRSWHFGLSSAIAPSLLTYFSVAEDLFWSWVFSCVQQGGICCPLAFEGPVSYVSSCAGNLEKHYRSRFGCDEFKIEASNWMWWYTPIMPAVGRMRQKDCPKF